jgi:hypothetical protein
MDLEEPHSVMFEPLLSGKLLKIHVSSPSTRAAMMGNHDGSLIVFACGCWTRKGETLICEELEEVLDVCPRLAARHRFRLCGQ